MSQVPGINPYPGVVSPAYIPAIDQNYHMGSAAATPGGGIASGNTGFTNVGSGTYTALNQTLQRYAEYFDPFIQKDSQQFLMWWRDRIPRGDYQFFNGLGAETRIFRGGIPYQTGLGKFKDISEDPSTGICGVGDYSTTGYAWERIEWSGKQFPWGSEPICLDTLLYSPQAKEQLAWILQVGADFGKSVQEVWNRETYISKSVQYKRSFVMTRDFDASSDSPRYYFNPFLTASAAAGTDAECDIDHDGDADALRILLGTGSITNQPGSFILFPADTDIEPLNFDVLDHVHSMLDQACGSAAIGELSGQKLYGLHVSYMDLEKFFKGNEALRDGWRRSTPQKLINGYDMGVREFRGWTIQDDTNQMRFKLVKRMDSFSGAAFTSKTSAPADMAFLEGRDVYMAEFVPAVTLDTSRAMLNTSMSGGVGADVPIGDMPGVPVPNPEYWSAELAIAPVFMNNVMTNFFEGARPTSLGSQTTFGPFPGLNGNWNWVNYQTDNNPVGKVGRFLGEYRIHQKPDTKVFYTTSFLYRRSTEKLRSIGPIDNWMTNQGDPSKIGAVAIDRISTPTALVLAATDDTAAKIAAKAVAANDAAFADTLITGLRVRAMSPVKGAAVGKNVTVTLSGVATSGFITETRGAPDYSIAFTEKLLSGPGAVSATGIGYCEDDNNEALVGKLAKWTVVYTAADAEATPAVEESTDITWTAFALNSAADTIALA